MTKLLRDFPAVAQSEKDINNVLQEANKKKAASASE